jgi:hypothetical protein
VSFAGRGGDLGLRLKYLVIVPLCLFLLALLPAPRAAASTALPQGEVAGTSVSFHFPDPLPSNCLPTTNDYDTIRNATLLNAQYVRFDIWWDEIEPNQNSYSTCALTYYTQALEFIQNEGLKAIAVLGTNEPNWVYTSCLLGAYPNVEQTAAREYAGNVSRNLGQWISFYQLGNELYSPQYLNEERCGSTPEPYMIAIAKGIQQGATTPYQTIVNIYADYLPGDYQAVCNPQGAWYTDLENALNDAGSYINVIAIDHYPGTFCSGTWANDGLLASLAGLASSYGKEYAITETGWSVDYSNNDAQNSYAEQTLSYIYSFAQSQLYTNPLLFVNWYQMTDNGAGSQPYNCCFGLQNAQTSNRPAFQTVATYFHELIGYPVVFQSDIPAGTQWCVTFNDQEQCNTSQSITFNAQPGSYSYSVSTPSCGTGCQYLPNPDSGNVQMEFAPMSENVGFTQQYEIAPTVSIVGGGTGYSPPILTYSSGGVTQTSSLVGPATSVYADSGTAWSVSGQLAGSTNEERWVTNQQTDGVVTSPMNPSLTYYHEFAISFSYSIIGGGAAPSPVVTFTQFGTPSSGTFGPGPSLYWLDAGSQYSIPGVLSSSNQAERWYASSTTIQGGVSSPVNVPLAYYHQFALDLSYSITGGGNPPPPLLTGTSAGSAIDRPLTQQPTEYWFDAGTQYSVQSQVGSGLSDRWITAQQTTGTSTSGNTQTYSYQHQFNLQFSVWPTGAGTVSESSGWYDSGSQALVSSTPAVGYTFESWNSSNSAISISNSKSPSTQITVGSSGVVTAIFISSQTTISVSTGRTSTVVLSSSSLSPTGASSAASSHGVISEFPAQTLAVVAVIVALVGSYILVRTRLKMSHGLDERVREKELKAIVEWVR